MAKDDVGKRQQGEAGGSQRIRDARPLGEQQGGGARAPGWRPPAAQRGSTASCQSPGWGARGDRLAGRALDDQQQQGPLASRDPQQQGPASKGKGGEGARLHLMDQWP